MTKADRIIVDLVNALDTIRREAEDKGCSTEYIIGVAEQAIANVRAQQVRNSDGYLVVKRD